jgi:hypothetical protein
MSTSQSPVPDVKGEAGPIQQFFRGLDWYFNGTLTQGDGTRRVPRQWAFPFLMLVHFLFLGPMPWLKWDGVPLNDWQAAVYVVGVGVLGAGAGWVLHLIFRTSMRLFWWQFGVVAIVTVLFLTALGFGHLADENPSWIAAQNWFFPHLWQPLAMLVFLVAASARVLAGCLLSGFPAKIKAAPNHGQLAEFVRDLWKYRRPEPHPSLMKSLFDALTSPVEILYPPALFLVVIDIRFAMHFFGTRVGWWAYSIVAVALGLLAYGALVWAERDNAIDALRTNVRRIFWYGGSWLTTVFVILLATCWLLDVAYVTTVMQGSRPVVVFLILAAYALFWTYEYWVNHTYGEELLNLLGTVRDKLYVEFDEFRICIHGSAKLSIVRQTDPTKPAERGQTFERSELFEQLFEKLGCPDLSAELGGAAKMYFSIMNVVIALPVVVFAYCVIHEHPVRIAVATADMSAPENLAGRHDMADLLFKDIEKPKAGARPQVILVAASGGGTRAALYTSSALDGLRLHGQIQRVKAVSGVSGGGVALAYFAAHHRELVDPDNKELEQAWDRYHDAMAYPYFIDVLRSSAEFRVPWHTSLSTLLPESFDRQFFKNSDERKFATLGACEIGLILNTTLAAESPPTFELQEWDAHNKRIKEGKVHLTDDQRRRSEFASSQYSGSRLVITNLTGYRGTFPRGQKDYPWNEILRFIVVNDPEFKLVRAASLNANFPPVFPNAPVDVTRKGSLHRYWVTDGGAEENRGQFSLLFAARDAMQRRLEKDDEQDAPFLPDIHLVIVEASGGSVEYKQDNGISANSNAPQKLANQLAIELGREIQGLYKELHAKRRQNPKVKESDPGQEPEFKTHFLPMPSAFRIDGGVGTHWMLPETARLGPPTVNGVDAEPDIYVNRDSVQMLIRAVHNPDYRGQHPAPKEAIKTVQRWTENDPLLPTHAKEWKDLCDRLKR